VLPPPQEPVQPGVGLTGAVHVHLLDAFGQRVAADAPVLAAVQQSGDCEPVGITAAEFDAAGAAVFTALRFRAPLGHACTVLVTSSATPDGYATAL
jgi:hypothetical protein